MLSKLVKGLSGLGGAAALTTGGVFLKNHVGRRMLISKANANIKAMSTGEYEGLYPDGNSLDDEWKISWVFAVGGHIANKNLPENGFTKSFFKQSEREFWGEIMKSEKSHIIISVDKKKEIEGGYGEYWEKYKESCLYWASKREAKDAAANQAACMLPEKWETYKERIMYKKYLETKEKRKDLDVMDFYWTIWRRFKKEKESDLNQKFETNTSHYDDFSNAFESWKTNKDDLFSNLNK